MTAVAEVEPTEQTQSNAPVADATRTQEERFRWRSYVHLGEGAVECEDGTTGKCRDEAHFHAVCRLPNPFQLRDITEKASAAKARRARMYRQEDSDVRVVMEDELDVLRDSPRELVADELIDRDFAEDYTAAVREVMDLDDPDFVPKDDEDIPKLYANIDQDREEYLRQRELPEEQRSEDFAELERTYAEFSRAIEEAMERIQKPKRDHLLSLETEELIDQVRRARIDRECFEVYLHTFMTWQMYACTYKPRLKGVASERVWPDINEMKYAEDTNVIVEVKATFEHLEAQLARSRQGKGF